MISDLQIYTILSLALVTSIFAIRLGSTLYQ
uniref:Photosystem I reaction center subunit XII n=1 Tax=Proboscia sp. TaxID=1923967 RepID=A0A2U9NM10_9STRA|nr:photosystem I protein M [Proboscia sp.]